MSGRQGKVLCDCGNVGVHFIGFDLECERCMRIRKQYEMNHGYRSKKRKVLERISQIDYDFSLRDLPSGDVDYILKELVDNGVIERIKPGTYRKL
jgi:hypothetical protein